MLEFDEIQFNMAKAIAYVIEFNTSKSFHKLLMEYTWFSRPLAEVNLQEILAEEWDSKMRTLATSKAAETQRDFEPVYKEVQHQVTVKFSEYLAPSLNPILRSLKDVELKEEEDGGSHVCAICLDEMVRWQQIKALPCKHCFHVDCIYKWLKVKLECPLCGKKYVIKRYRYVK